MKLMYQSSDDTNGTWFAYEIMHHPACSDHSAHAHHTSRRSELMCKACCDAAERMMKLKNWEFEQTSESQQIIQQALDEHNALVPDVAAIIAAYVGVGVGRLRPPNPP